MKLKDYLYYSEDRVKLYNADCLDVMRKLPDNYIDLIATDPPYGYSFMGKNWDKVVVPISHWKECLRVLKPGAFAFIMSAPRQDVLSRMIYNLQEAGFETGFSSIYWSYATGFPKASNISKKIDKQECKKELTKKLGRKPTKKEFEDAWKNYRKIISENPYNKLRGKSSDNHTIVAPQEKSFITSPKSPQAKELDGSYGGFQPKPAVEIIIVAMKPLDEKTYIDQALKNGKGITWLDNCRIPYESEDDLEKNQREQKYGHTTKFASGKQLGNHINQKGRFPANLLVSDDILNDGKISKGTIRKPTGKKILNPDDGWNQNQMEDKTTRGQNDSGSYSRYFDLDKWWIERVKQLPSEVQKVFPYLIVPKASKREKNKGCENLEDKTQGQDAKNRVWSDKCGNCGLKFIGGEPRCHCPSDLKKTDKKGGYQYKNNHPTVKPIKLMSYLITLGSREGDIVLDPFTGSGTTLIASKLLNRKGIGIEMSKEYCNIAKARIKGGSK